MKKLMIAAAAVAMAVGANAATFTWKWSVLSTAQSFNGYDAPTVGSIWSSASVVGGMAYYFIDAGVMSQGELLTAMRNGTDWSSAVLASGNTISSKDENNGKIAQNPFTTTTTYPDEDPVPSVKLNAYTVLINSDENYACFSATVGQDGDKSGGQVDFNTAIAISKVLRDKTGTASYTSVGWYAIPEPTSGLLLLIGVAGLSLRRRRA